MSKFFGAKKYGSVYANAYGEEALPATAQDDLEREFAENSGMTPASPPLLHTLDTSQDEQRREETTDDIPTATAARTNNSRASIVATNNRDDTSTVSDGEDLVCKVYAAPPPPPPMPPPVVTVPLRFGTIMREVSSSPANPRPQSSKSGQGVLDKTSLGPPTPLVAPPMPRSTPRLRAVKPHKDARSAVIADIQNVSKGKLHVKVPQRDSPGGLVDDGFFAFTELTAVPPPPPKEALLYDEEHFLMPLTDLLTAVFTPTHKTTKAVAPTSADIPSAASDSHTIAGKSQAVAPTGPVQDARGYSSLKGTPSAPEASSGPNGVAPPSAPIAGAYGDLECYATTGAYGDLDHAGAYGDLDSTEGIQAPDDKSVVALQPSHHSPDTFTDSRVGVSPQALSPSPYGDLDSPAVPSQVGPFIVSPSIPLDRDCGVQAKCVGYCDDVQPTTAPTSGSLFDALRKSTGLEPTTTLDSSGEADRDLVTSGGYLDDDMGDSRGLGVGQPRMVNMRELFQLVVNVQDGEALKRVLLGCMVTNDDGHNPSLDIDRFATQMRSLGPQLLKTGGHNRDWNSEFQMLQETADSEEKFRDLSRLAHDFVYAATTYAKIIISESCLPDHEKTIKPIDLGGVAGGQKFVCQNILFKFALDMEIVDGLWMYGGNIPSDENAMKAAAHELKGLCHYYSTHVPGLRYPLLAYIDYKGYRMIAISVLPIGRDSIRYGSSDSGDHVHADIPELTEKLSDAGKRLNLQAHVTGTNPANAKELASCGDLEGHIGTDGKFYVLDFARAFPAEAPARNHREPRAVYYKLLRPETVRSNETPLSSDAFTTWGKLDSRFQEHNKNVLKATLKLLLQEVPAFAESLDIHVEEMTGANLVTELHRAGINIRHLGQVRHKCKSRKAKDMLLLEMVVRVVKNYLRERMRETMRRVRGLSQEPFKAEVIRVFNLVLSKQDAQQADKRDAEQFWTRIRQMVNDKFWNGFTKLSGLTPAESALDANLRDFIPMQHLFQRLNALLGVRITEQAMEQLIEDPGSFEFVAADVEEVYAMPRFMDIIDSSEALALEKMANRKTGREKLRLLELAGRRFEAALRSTPGNFMVLYHWGKVLLLQAKANFIAADRIDLLVKATEKLRHVMAINPRFLDSCIHAAEASLTIGMLHKAEMAERYFSLSAEMFSKVIELDRTYLPLAQRYAYIITQSPTRSRLRGSIELCKGVLEVAKTDGLALALWALNVEKLVSGYDEFSTERSLDTELVAFSQAFGTAVVRDFELIPLITRIAYEMKQKAYSNKALFAFAGEIFKALVTIESTNQLMLEWAYCLWEFALSHDETVYRSALASAAIKFDCVLSTDPSCMDDEVLASIDEQQRKLVNMVELAECSQGIRESLRGHLRNVLSLQLGWSNLSLGSAALLASMAPSITSLDLSHHNNASELLQEFRFHCPRVRDLTLAFCGRLEPKDVIQCVQVWPMMERLDVADCRLMTAVILDSISSLTSLRALNMRSSSWSTHHSYEDGLQKVINNCTALEELVLNSCKVTNEHIAVLSACTTLTSLSLAYCSRAEILTPWLEKLPNLRHLDASNAYRDTDAVIATMVKHAPHLETLVISNCKKLTDFGVQHAVKLLNNGSLTRLEFDNCFRVSDDAIEALASCQAVTNLQRLSIAHNVGLHEPSIRRLLSGLPRLLYLNVSKCNVTGDTLNALPPRENAVTGDNTVALKELVAAQCAGVTSVVELMVRARDLVKVDLRKTGVTDASIKAMSDHCRGLRQVNVSECNAISDDGAITLATLPLEDLNVSSCPHITDELIQYLVQYCSSLRSLDVSSNVRVTDEVVGCLHHLPNLTSLSLAGCVRVKNGAIVRLAQHAPYLQHLDLSATKLINEAAILFLARHCHSLQSLVLQECPRLKNMAAASYFDEFRPNVALVADRNGDVMTEMRGHRQFLKGKPGNHVANRWAPAGVH